jgi:hypothetical protein
MLKLRKAVLLADTAAVGDNSIQVSSSHDVAGGEHLPNTYTANKIAFKHLQLTKMTLLVEQSAALAAAAVHYASRCLPLKPHT